MTSGITYESLGDEELGLQDGDVAIVKCERYMDNATISGKIGEPIADVDEFERIRNLNSKGRHIEGQKTPVIIRKATAEDLKKIEENKAKAIAAHSQTHERIMAHGLDMKLIHTHYSIDQKLLIFQFSAEGRIDFRELLRDLSALFRIRVELRQIGVRDEASLLGGIGICGRPFCCTAFLTNFNSINVKMAKQQGISLNPQNISGCCGRLKCCLYYEADAYKNAPIVGREKPQVQLTDAEVDERELAKLDERESQDSGTTADVERPRTRPQRQSRLTQNEPQDANARQPQQGDTHRHGDIRQQRRNQGRQNQQGGHPPRDFANSQQAGDAQQPQNTPPKQPFRPNKTPGLPENKKHQKQDEQ